MLDDEIRHGQAAPEQGGKKLPQPIRSLMWEWARLITETAERFWL